VKITVCQFHGAGEALERDWADLLAHTRSEASDLVLLPEMPFCPWLALSSSYRPEAWEAAIEAHDQWEQRFPEFGSAHIAATRPVDFGNGRNNVAFVWNVQNGLRTVHSKSHLENRKGCWEPVWYVGSPADFTPVKIASSVAGFLIGAELQGADAVDQYVHSGVTLLLTPRSTASSESDLWLGAARNAARRGQVCCASSNRAPDGGGWIIDATGTVLAITDESRPFVTVDLAHQA
jgi:N-carbamoylputrescine amidase